MDYREIAGETFDAIASIGMVEHVGAVNIDAYSAKLFSLLKPGGRLLNHGIARLRVGDAEAGPFSERYVFPDAAPLHLSRIQLSLERAGFHTRHVEDFPDDYARTLLEWQHRFESNIERARELGGDERVRVWRIYLRVSRQGFESGFMSVYQVRAVKPALGTASRASARACFWSSEDSAPPSVPATGGPVFIGAAGERAAARPGGASRYLRLRQVNGISHPVALARPSSAGSWDKTLTRSKQAATAGSRGVRQDRPQAAARSAGPLTRRSAVCSP